jgi:hypothetical protein
MAKYEDLMESPWINTTLYAESIPHLFHYDLAYLWVLEKQADQRPTDWRDRIDAWRCLLELLLTGELAIKQEMIQDPLLKYTKSYGIEKIYWVSLAEGGHVVGVLSPAVLVRPLPDFKSSDLIEWKRDLAQKRRPDEFRFLVGLAVDYLKQGQHDKSFRYKLAGILEKEFKPGGDSLKGVPSVSLSMSFLSQLFWTQSTADSSCIEDLEIEIKGFGDEKVYQPRCRVCNYVLTKTANAPPIEVQGETFQVQCENPAGGHMNEESLSNYLVWVRSAGEAILWERQPLVIGNWNLPPSPKRQGINVEFEWSAAQLRERQKRFLKLQFPNRTVSERRITDIFFSKVLVPGKFERFTGLAIRPEWLDAIADPDRIVVETDSMTSKITFRNMQVNGLSSPISWTFAGRFSVHPEPELGVGVYPDPQYVPDNWRWYRMLLHGSKRSGYQIHTSNGRMILPWLRETTEGLGSTFSVTSTSDNNIGATFLCSQKYKKLASNAITRINLGIDFGTTNTIVYHLAPGKSLSDVEGRPSDFCFDPSSTPALVQWLAELSSAKPSKTIGDFLPGVEYLQDRRDPRIVPSALWCFDDEYVIRWEAEKPIGNAIEVMGFKWDENGVDRSSQRKAFIKELLFLILPSILKNAIESGSITTWNLNVHTGVTFPLAFGGDDRQKMRNLYNDIRDELTSLTPFKFVFNSINESSACKILLGSPNPTDTFLVADMGGGTIDLALFTGDNTEADQIGSIRFAGEAYIDSLIKKRALPKSELRDLIAEGKCHYHYGGDTIAQATLNRFIAIAFEFLRTMIEAYRMENHDQLIHLVLAGNGWHLVEAFSDETKTRTAKQVFSEYYQHIVDQMHDKRIKRRHPLTALESNKHLVAIGALKHAVAGSDELSSSEPTVSKLPAGRGMRFGDPKNSMKVIKWNDLIGGKVPFQITSGKDLRNASLQVDFNDMPPLHADWRSFLISYLGVSSSEQIPLPDEMKLREQIRKCIPEGTPKLTKGPLQITIEQHWIEWLKE